MKRIALVLAAMATTGLAVWPAHAQTCAYLSASPPQLCGDDDKVVPEQLRSTWLSVNGATAVELTPGGTATMTVTSTGITGTGTANYVPKWTGASTLGLSLIYDNGVKVGVNNTNPATTLDVGGGVSASDNTIFCGGYMACAGVTGTGTDTATGTAHFRLLDAIGPTVNVNVGTATNQVVGGSDPRLTDARASTNTLYAGTTNVTFSTGTGTGTASSVAVSANPKIHVAATTATHAHTMVMPNATKTYAQNGTYTVTGTDLGTTATGANVLAMTTTGGKLASGQIPWTDVNNHLTPRATGTYSLGSPSLRFTTLDLSTGLYVGSAMYVTDSAITGNLGTYLTKNFQGYAVSETTSTNSTVTWVDILSQSYTPKSYVGANGGTIAAVAAVQMNISAGRCCIRVVIAGNNGHHMCMTANGFVSFPAHHMGVLVNNTAAVTVKVQMLADTGQTCATDANRGDVIIFEK